ncbi:conserved hypothetical protein [Ricinus communis]|uniref:DUF4283 domain-containing protein n=1 Tax=Ricinus communis TaxID=3988 RepID=B9RSF7_RICCO|nr:conserved hypothetical protein [Ricinus communis]
MYAENLEPPTSITPDDPPYPGASDAFPTHDEIHTDASCVEPEIGTVEADPHTVSYKEDKALTVKEGDIVILTKSGQPAIILSRQLSQYITHPCKQSIVVKLLGRPIGYNMLCSRIKALWKSISFLKVVDLDNNYFLIRFSHEEDMNLALIDGP